MKMFLLLTTVHAHSYFRLTANIFIHYCYVLNNFKVLNSTFSDNGREVEHVQYGFSFVYLYMRLLNVYVTFSYISQ